MVQNTPYWDAKECESLQNKTQSTKKVRELNFLAFDEGIRQKMCSRGNPLLARCYFAFIIGLKGSLFGILSFSVLASQSSAFD